MPRIDTLEQHNVQTQGARRREWLLHHSPLHLEHCAAVMRRAIQERGHAAARSTVILGSGACTEVPLIELVRASDEVVLVDLDEAAMRRAVNEIAAPSLRRRVRLVVWDISGGVSKHLTRLLHRQSWGELASQDGTAVFDAAALCLDECLIPDPPEIETLGPGDFGVVISSLVLTQLFSYPLLDVLDQIQYHTPELLGAQERHRRYQEAAQAFRMRIIAAHLRLIQHLLDQGGSAALLSDVRGFVFDHRSNDEHAEHRRWLPLVPRAFPDQVRAAFTVLEEAHWEWLTDLPEGERPGRGYEVAGYVLRH